MVVSTYFITLETRDPFDTSRYDSVAGSLANALQAVLGDAANLEKVIHTPNFSDARVEVEIAQRDRTQNSHVGAHTVLQAEAPKRFGFDKNIFSNMIRAELPFAVSVHKRSA